MDQGEIGTRAQLFTMAPAIWNLEEHATVQSGSTKTDCRNLSPVWLGKAVLKIILKRPQKIPHSSYFANLPFIISTSFCFFFTFFLFFHFTARLYCLRTGLTGMHNPPLDEAPTTASD